MARSPIQLAAVVACLAMVALLALLQFVLTPRTQAPTMLYLLFSALWLFGAVMLLAAPRFGAAGTIAWGMISAVASIRTHAASVENAVLVGAALAATALSALFLTQRIRGRA